VNTTTTVTTLTPAQFTAARALASKFGHLWAGVPDGTYDTVDIEAWSDEKQHLQLPAGIFCPTLDKQGTVIHTTGAGRLSWEITPWGNVTLIVSRPAGEGSVEVARVQVINDNPDRFSIVDEDYLIHTSSREEWETNPAHLTWDPDLKDGRVFGRHVEALLPAIVALLEAGEIEGDEDQLYEQARMWLRPMIEGALPEPLFLQPGDEAPTTYHTLEQRYSSETPYYVVHHQEQEFPTESERVAVYMSFLLQEQPELSLVEAAKQALKSSSYRPDRWQG